MKCTISILQCTVSVFCIFPQKDLYCLSRDVLLPASEAPLLPAALLLHRHRLRSLLHDGLRLLDVLLAGPQGGGDTLYLFTFIKNEKNIVATLRLAQTRVCNNTI